VALTKIDIVEKIHNELDFTKKESSDIFESVLSLIKSTLEAGEDIKISGFGNFEVKQKKDRKGRNPATGEDLTIEARRIISFKPSNKLKIRINDNSTE
jgi:integration host factor subunit alpha